MRLTRQNVTQPRREKVYESDSFKDGNFTKEELFQYGLSDNEIATILDYQVLLPVLQEDDENWISARLLHKQLKVSKDFSSWIKNQIKDMDLTENENYKIETSLKANQNIKGGDKRSMELLNIVKKIILHQMNKSVTTSQKIS